MSEEKNITLEKVFAAISEVGGAVGGTNERLSRIEGDLGEVKVKVGAIGGTCHERGLRLDEAERKIEAAAQTGVIHLTDMRARWSTLKIMAAILLGIVTFLGGAFGLYSALQSAKAAQPFDAGLTAARPFDSK